MQENMSATVETINANEANVATTETQEAPVENENTSKGAKQSKKQRKAQRKAKAAKNSKSNASATSKVRVRRYSTVAVKCKNGRHVLVATDKKGAEHFATGRNELSRAAKINAVLLSSGRPLAVREIQEKLDAIYGANEVRAVANHMRKLLTEKLVTLSEGRYLLTKKGAPKSEAPAPVTESEESK